MTAPATILICDDERDVREMLDEYLAKRGFATVQAGNSDELRSRLEAGQIDLILLDINMPGEDGLTTLRALRVSSQIPS